MLREEYIGDNEKMVEMIKAGEQPLLLKEEAQAFLGYLYENYIVSIVHKPQPIKKHVSRFEIEYSDPAIKDESTNPSVSVEFDKTGSISEGL